MTSAITRLSTLRLAGAFMKRCGILQWHWSTTQFVARCDTLVNAGLSLRWHMETKLIQTRSTPARVDTACDTLIDCCRANRTLQAADHTRRDDTDVMIHHVEEQVTTGTKTKDGLSIVVRLAGELGNVSSGCDNSSCRGGAFDTG